jgi:hypothetical protein
MKPTEQALDNSFQHHEAIRTSQGDITLLDYKHKDYDIMYRVSFIHKRGTLFVCGDYGQAVYEWSDPQTLDWMALTDLGYFAGKCKASPVGAGFQIEGELDPWCVIHHYALRKAVVDTRLKLV